MAAPETAKNGDAEPTFEALLDDAERIAERLESGALTLDESLAAYEAGVARLRRGSELLAKAEEKLKRLVEDAGGPRLEPFEDPSEE